MSCIEHNLSEYEPLGLSRKVNVEETETQRHSLVSRRELPPWKQEALTCNVCDRTFSCPKQLSAHKQKKRHFGCSACDSLFTSLMALEHHKEEFEHWSDEDDICTDESDEDDDTVVSEECERLL
ncbi:hypothetical protein GWI33_009794 [Rhynchophorus ferrugineus]|uniref:C2H2-type domain-containing protein n=1 Tax=Rhynchophorus ferrugineus TaxID=354439 RepID=A0A834ITJ7_RHYFE|nr:hypothetical protein GWI33_009794 [Rhynchophorus ferrugineus]